MRRLLKKVRFRYGLVEVVKSFEDYEVNIVFRVNRFVGFYFMEIYWD